MGYITKSTVSDITKLNWSQVEQETTLEDGDGKSNPIYAMSRSNEEGYLERVIVLKET